MIKYIAVVNKSTLVSVADGQTMCLACQEQVFAHLAPAWNIVPTPVTHYTDESQIPVDQLVFTGVLRIVDSSDVDGALGFHTEEASGVIDGEIAAGPSFQNGSTATTGQYPVSATLSHEICELLVDEFVNDWIIDAAGQSWSKEVCDPVEAYSYAIGAIPVSDFVLPSFFDSATTEKTVDYLGKLSTPFTIAPNGYAVRGDTPQTASQVFGDTMPEWRQDLKKMPFSRSERAKAAAVK